MLYDHEIPTGMTVAEFNGNPLRQLLRDAAYWGAGGLPSKAELDVLGLPDSASRKVAKAARELAAIHDEGAHQDAWEQGDKRAAEILADLTPEQRTPDQEPDPLVGLGPDELAARVPRDGMVTLPRDN